MTTRAAAMSDIEVLAEALHETCRAEWAQLAGYGATGVTQHEADAHMHTAPTIAAALAARGYRIVSEESLEKIAALHDRDPEGGMGYRPDSGEYGPMADVCLSCGTSDEYGVEWPCQTRQLIAQALEAKETSE
jgi:hypothetical protein